MGSCSRCGAVGVKVYATFGKYKCYDCIQATKSNKSGHSGMIYNPLVSIDDYLKSDSVGLILELVPKSHPLFVKWYIEHYPGSKGIVGRQLNYLIYYMGKPIGIIGGASPPRNYKLFRKFFNTNSDLSFLNNNVYRLIETPIKNCGTQVLKQFRLRVYNDYKIKYDTTLVGLVTFVEPPRTGAVYKADNWVYLGETQGVEVRRRGVNWMEKTYSIGIKKHIYAYKYKS